MHECHCGCEAISRGDNDVFIAVFKHTEYPELLSPSTFIREQGVIFAQDSGTKYIYTSPVGGSIADGCTTTIAAYKIDRHLQQASEGR